MNKKNIQNIIENCLSLMERGYSLSYCLKKYDRYSAQLKPYLETAVHLRDLKELKPDQPFRQSALNQALSQVPQKKSRARWLKPAIAFITAFIIVSFSFAGTAYASQDSIPGQTLYPIKRTVEEAWVFISPPSRKVRLHLEMLETRIEEARLLISQPNTSEQLADEVIESMQNQYRRCQQYGCLSSEEEEDILQDMENISTGYQNRYGQQQQKRRHQ